MPTEKTVLWAFREKEITVYSLGEKVAYSWTCGKDHDHVIECLWVWHDCDLNLRPVDDHWTSIYTGWRPAGVGMHDLITVEPLHIEASVYWPSCCGMHGWIRDGAWIDA